MRTSELIAFVIIASVVLFILGHEIRWLIASLRNRQFLSGKRAMFVHCLFFVGVIAAAYAFFFEPFWLEVKHIEITTTKLHKNSFTVVQVSDLHCDIKKRNEEHVVRLINEINPDVIVFTGDAINTPEALPYFKDVLNRLKAKSGKFAVKGNWDAWYWKDLDLFTGTGFVELPGSSALIHNGDDAIAIVGFNPDQPFDPGILRQVPAGVFSAFLFHYPGINEEIGSDSADLFLAGHTHGGQVVLPFYGALVTLSKYGKKYEAGAYKLNGSSLLYVSRGIGMEGGIAPRVRFLSRPEIAVFHIKPGA